MNAYPIVIFCGKARSGKDTAAGFLVNTHNAQTIALADPLKRMAYKIFGVPVAQLWGPSETRNQVVEHLTPDMASGILRWVDEHADDLVRDELSLVVDPVRRMDAAESLKHWTDQVTAKLAKDGTLTARYILQTLGTEWGRDKIDPDLWAKLGVITAEKLLTGEYAYNPGVGLTKDRGWIAPLVAITDGRFPNEILAVRRLGGLAIKIERPEKDDSAEKAGIAGHRSESELDKIPPHFFSAIVQNDDTLEYLQRRVTFCVEQACMPARLPMPVYSDPALSGL